MMMAMGMKWLCLCVHGDGRDSWIQQAKLSPKDGEAIYYFGNAWQSTAILLLLELKGLMIMEITVALHMCSSVMGE